MDAARRPRYTGPVPHLALIDSHCHLNAPQFDADRAAVLQRAGESGVRLMLDVGTEPNEWERSLALARADPRVRCILGLHPNRAALWSPVVSDHLTRLLASPLVAAVGETGLDYYRMGASPEQQHAVFVAHLEIARRLDLPVVIHAREAFDDILAVLAEHGRGTTGVLHSFAGTVEHALRAVELGYAIGLSGPVTYRSGANVRDAATAAPLDRLLIETDSPYLPPQPHRGKRNEPAHVALIAAAVAEAQGMPVEDLARATSENAARLFRFARASTSSTD
ncbi:MAG: TatD family hydrolase [Chloroflexota bacterium]|nr:TatD family hydrolase [Chloroflexota bacterium]